MQRLPNFSSRRAVPPILCVALLALFLWGESQAFAFGKKPVALPDPAPPAQPIPAPTPADPNAVIRARWEGVARDGADWSLYAYNQISVAAPNLLSKTPSDITAFCANYPSLSDADKKNFWVYLLSSMAELESSFDPNSTYRENFNDANGNPVISAGLLQLSISDSKYGCAFKSNSDLFDPHKNLDCGLRILNKWVNNDGRLAGKIGTAWAGGARYWSTLRTGAKLNKIESWVQAQRICAK